LGVFEKEKEISIAAISRTQYCKTGGKGKLDKEGTAGCGERGEGKRGAAFTAEKRWGQK